MYAGSDREIGPSTDAEAKTEHGGVGDTDERGGGETKSGSAAAGEAVASEPAATTTSHPVSATASDSGPVGRPGSRRGSVPSKSRSVTLRDWFLTILVALCAATFIRGYIVEAYRIPTTSMERTLLAGDFVIVSKLHYGPRLPESIGIPFTDWHIPGLRLPRGRVPGLIEPRRGDIIVFNFPVEEGPTGRKTHYISRVVGMPGDTLSIVDKIPHANGRAMPLLPEMQQKWLAIRKSTAPFPIARLESRDVEEVGRVGSQLDGVSFQSTAALAEEVATWSEIASIQPLVVPQGSVRPDQIFPSGSGYDRDNYGPLHVPARGDVLHLTRENLSTYRDIIERFEGHDLSYGSDEIIRVDGQPTNRYVVEQDYYFVMGDNRDSSYDSRFWGFVPWDHVVGRATMIYFSWDRETSAARFGRLFREIR